VGAFLFLAKFAIHPTLPYRVSVGSSRVQEAIANANPS
jgi:hypothetical protein